MLKRGEGLKDPYNGLNLTNAQITKICRYFNIQKKSLENLFIDNSPVFDEAKRRRDLFVTELANSNDCNHLKSKLLNAHGIFAVQKKQTRIDFFLRSIIERNPDAAKNFMAMHGPKKLIKVEYYDSRYEF